LIDLFQKVAVSKDSVFGRAPQSAKSPFALSFFAKLFFFGLLLQRKKANKHKR
jgi:hypothetical protein